MILVQLGRAGDILNVLPLAFALSHKLGRVNWLVGKEHAPILEGVSYVNPIVWDGGQDSLPNAISRYSSQHLIVTQAHLNHDTRRLTDSFATEQWRYAGLLNERNQWPLLFDRRDPKREAQLVVPICAKHIGFPFSEPFSLSAFQRSAKRPRILVATDSISTPYPHANKLIASIRGLDADVIDLADVKAARIYDLIALYDAADCLVSVDTAHVHLARASRCPLVMLQNDGWRGATPPPQAVAHWRYSEIGDNLAPVVEATEKVCRARDSVRSLALVINTFKPDTDRHRRAIATHPPDTIYARFDHRPKVRELLARGLETGKDCVVFTNDDVAFPEGSLDAIRRHAAQWDFGCSRRPRTPVHCGREIFWFKSKWLLDHWDEVPECYWTVQKPDLILAKWLRRLRGIETTYANLDYDFPPVELPAGLITHEEHESHWANNEVERSFEGQANEAIWKAMA